MAITTAPCYTPRQMIERLIGFDTTSRNSNLVLINFIAEYLKAHGVPHSLAFDANGTKANLYATLGPALDGGIVLSGHTDVVPVDGQDWSSPPFSVREHDGRLYGRGTADMKSFIAIALALVPEFLACRLKVPLHFALSYDEEVGCLGTETLLDHIRKQSSRPALVIVGEPTNMTVVSAHKGIRVMRTTVFGHEVHSSQVHKGVNAIAVAAELIGFLGDLGRELQENADPRSPFNPPYTSVHVGTIQGGTALNIVPRRCHFDWEFRPLPDCDEEAVIARVEEHAKLEVLPRLKRVAPDADIVIEHGHRVPPFQAPEASAAVSLALRLAEQNATRAVSYGTEAGFFEEDGFATVVCGPGDIAEAHQPDEYITLAQVEACVAFLRRLRDALSA